MGMCCYVGRRASSMDQLATQLLATCLQFPANLVVTDVQVSPATLTLQVARDAPSARCPLCQQHSDRVHGRLTFLYPAYSNTVSLSSRSTFGDRRLPYQYRSY